MSSVRCRFCDHHNPEGARFCNACGSPVHLKPCPQCEAVNDVAAAECYECGAALEIGAAPAGLAAVAEHAAADAAQPAAESRHVPESFGARLAELPPVEGSANLAAAERREAFARTSRTSRALFFAVALLAVAAVGYYGYEHARQGSSRGETATASLGGQTPETSADSDQRTSAVAHEDAAQPTTEASGASTAAAGPRTPAVAESAGPRATVEQAGSPPSNDAPASELKPGASAGAAAGTREANATHAAAKARQASAQSAAKPDSDPYSRPASASHASAIATQQTIERYLGNRAGTAPQRSPY